MYTLRLMLAGRQMLTLLVDVSWTVRQFSPLLSKLRRVLYGYNRLKSLILVFLFILKNAGSDGTQRNQKIHGGEKRHTYDLPIYQIPLPYTRELTKKTYTSPIFN